MKDTTYAGLLGYAFGRASAPTRVIERQAEVQVPVYIRPDTLEFLDAIGPSKMIWFLMYASLGKFADAAAKARGVDLARSDVSQEWRTWAFNEAAQQMSNEICQFIEQYLTGTTVSDRLALMERIFRGLRDFYQQQGL
jgi:hypothetical protein